jgi:uncharacterized protein (TIGR03083 family)
MTQSAVGPTDDQARLSGYVDVWWQAIGDFLGLLEQLSPADWSAPTDLPGWDVHAVAAHTAHLEAVLTGAPEDPLTVAEGGHVRGLMGVYTESGVVARRDRTPDELINEISASATARHTALLADPPTDAAATPDRLFPGASWTWETLLRNRPLDVWMHEQDVRRAVGRPGGLDSPAAVHVADYLAESLGVVLAKRVGAAPGTTAVLAVDGSAPTAYGVNDEARGHRLATVPDEPTVRLGMDRETFVLLAGGRRRPAPGAVRVDGDADLGERLLDRLVVTR